MKILPIRIFNEFDSSINLYELIYWSFFFFLEYIFPLLLDPLGFTNELLGYEFDEIFEILILVLLPLIVIYFGDTISGYHYMLGFFFYGIMSAPFSYFLFHKILVNVTGYLLVFIMFDELIENRTDNEGDFDDDAEDFNIK